MELIIYGAKSIALGIKKAVSLLYPGYPVRCFLVQSGENNPAWLDGLPVREIGEFAATASDAGKKGFHVLVGTPEDLHPEIAGILERHGFRNHTCMDSGKEARLMGRYFSATGGFPPLGDLPAGERKSSLCVLMAMSGKDKKIRDARPMPGWVVPMQAGAALGDIPEGAGGGQRDDTGSNISLKNGNYCELTALYWLWKNVLAAGPGGPGGLCRAEYYGLYQYRRVLDITEKDLYRIGAADAVLQFPTLHEPDIGEHHARYVAESDWDAMLRALGELHPGQAGAFRDAMRQPYFYNYNLVVAKKEVLADYCAWLFPILERTEQLSVPAGAARSDRYIGYLGESLMTFYFLHNRDRLKVYHAGRRMLV